MTNFKVTNNKTGITEIVVLKADGERMMFIHCEPSDGFFVSGEYRQDMLDEMEKSGNYTFDEIK